MNNITLISCSYNTPIVTENMLKTFTTIHPECKILICDNSTNNETSDILDNAKIPYIKNIGGLHGPSVDVLFERCETDYVLLVDTDVLFLKTHDDIFNQFKAQNITLMGEIVGDRGGKKLYPRVNPWHCFINLKTVKDNNIKFFDLQKRLMSTDRIYDIGSSFFEELRNRKLRIADFNGNNYYYRHYEGMSWHVNKFGKVDGDIDTDNTATHTSRGILEHGKRVLEIYLQDTQYTKALKLQYNNL